jgi:hypothetical protein
LIFAYLPYSFSLFQPLTVKQVVDVTGRSHVQALGNPLNHHRGLRPHAGRQRHLDGIAFEPPCPFAGLPTAAVMAVALKYVNIKN